MINHIYSGVFAIILAITVTSCGKSANHSTFYQEESIKVTEKGAWASDQDLINAIKGLTADYVSIPALEDYLYDNAKLSEDVINVLIADQRVPDYVVETALVLSAPLSSTSVNELTVHRPNISISVITQADNIPASVGYAIINSEHRIILFGNDIVKTVKPGNDDCNCGEGVIKIGSNYTAITLTSTVTPTNPNEMKPCTSANTTWTCGDVVYADQTGGGPSNATYTIQCAQSTNKCFKNPKDARRDYDNR